MTEEFLIPLIEAGGLSLVAALSIWGLMRAYKSRESLMAQMAQREENFHKERLAAAEEKAEFMRQTHAETLAMVDKLQTYMERQTMEMGALMTELVNDGTKALALNQGALQAVQTALAQNGEILIRNSQTWEQLMGRIAA